jgi:diguanylate cyclase (GGDEF)-like protein
MALDLHSLFLFAIFASVVAGLLLLLSWLQNRKVLALAFWAAGMIIGAVGVALLAARGDIADVWSITAANAIIAVAYGIMWGGARHFDGRRASVALMLAGAIIWVAACQFEAFFGAPLARVVLMSAIIVAYSLLTAWEFWQGRDEGLLSRIPIVVFLLIHAAVVVIRVPFAGSVSVPMASQQIYVGWWTFAMFEAVFFSFCAAYLYGGVARERAVLRYKHASLIDPLTGVENRRAFLERGEKLLQRTVFDGRAAVLLLFDLDKFKTINDTFGHHAGDRVLTTFCRVATAALRPGDLFGRLGGEEFAALLPHASLDDGLAAAERVRASFEATPQKSGVSTFTTTVSIGVAMSSDRDLAALLSVADRVLYRAKANGRNRIEHARAGSAARTDGTSAAPHRMAG